MPGCTPTPGIVIFLAVIRLYIERDATLETEANRHKKTPTDLQ